MCCRKKLEQPQIYLKLCSILGYSRSVCGWRWARSSPLSSGMVYDSGVLDDLKHGRRSASLSDLSHCLNYQGKKNISWRSKKMKKEIYYKQHWTSIAFKQFSRAASSLSLSPFSFSFGSSASTPSDNQGSQSFSCQKQCVQPFR